MLCSVHILILLDDGWKEPKDLKCVFILKFCNLVSRLKRYFQVPQSERKLRTQIIIVFIYSLYM